MAEAHQAVSYSELIKQESTDANHDKEVLSLVWQSGVRSWRKRVARFLAKVRNGAYPAHLESLWVIIALVSLMHYSAKRVPYDLVNVLVVYMPASTFGWQAITCCVVSLIYWIGVCLAMRYMLKWLLMYKGFMFEARGKGISWQTKVWAVLVKLFVKWNTPSLYSFQGSLPCLPLPSVKDTMTRYLRSMRPLLDDENYDRVKKQAEEFQEGIGKKFQRYLVLKSWWSSNYVSDWWEQYVYLRGRSPLMVNSNYYGTDTFELPTNCQTTRTANFIYLMLQFRRQIERQEVKPIIAQGLVPLCSWQYERMFNTVRVPGLEEDKIVHYEDIKHIVVMRDGCYYRVPIHHNGRLLNAAEIKFQLDHIVKLSAKSSHGEKYLASLTAWDRTKWAQTRNKHFATGINRISLEAVESSAFFIVLGDEPFEYGQDTNSYDDYARLCLHGKIYDRWFDKCFQLCMGTNARFAMCAEHTFADAPALGHMFEDTCFYELQSYDANGNIKAKLEMKPPLPSRLDWEFSADLIRSIDEAYADGLKVINNVDHKLVLHDAFGKGFIKTCRVSPDAYIQLALQLAFYRDFGKFSLTYEACMTRLYREGRTETVRPCTIESAAWVRSMENSKSSAVERMKLLQDACKRHQTGYLEAMCGKGIDRHLFCLYVVSRYLEIESPFLKEVVSEPWRLSTSQTPHGQTPKIDLKKHPGLTTPGGGFGPVSHDGYSVSYIISGEDRIFFHLSSNKNCETTSTARFADNIFKAMGDIKKLFEDFNAEKKK